MIRASDLLAFMKAFTHLHSVANMQMHPVHASTLCSLLDICEREVLGLEKGRDLAATPSACTAETNVIPFRRPQ